MIQAAHRLGVRLAFGAGAADRAGQAERLRAAAHPPARRLAARGQVVVHAHLAQVVIHIEPAFERYLCHGTSLAIVSERSERHDQRHRS